MDVRLCDLELDIAGTALEARVAALHEEFERAGLRFRPYVWLSTDWFTPDGVTGFAIPFFLAHPRLARIEHHQMFEVEGGSHTTCMKLLRHEAAHAIDNAYRLHRRKSWRETFGPFSTPYRQLYVPKPSSKSHVQNLDFWYAQSHPVEDFAETFAVWLQPGSRWRRRYAGWPALRKLEYVEALMQQIADQPPPVRSRIKPDSLPRVRMTLGEYYRKKQKAYGDAQPWAHDRLLRRLFSDDPGYADRDAAAAFLRRSRLELRTRVAALTGEYRYVVDQALNAMIARCKAQDLRMVRSARETRLDAAILLTVLTVSFLRGGVTHYSR